MQKFLSIPIDGETNQLIAVDSIMLIEQASTTTVTIQYATVNAATDLITLTHTEMAAADATVRDRIQDSVISALATSWHKPSFDVTLSNLVSAANGPVVITTLALS